MTMMIEGSLNDTCTCNSDNKSDPPFYPINIQVVKSRIGRPLREQIRYFGDFPNANILFL